MATVTLRPNGDHTMFITSDLTGGTPSGLSVDGHNGASKDSDQVWNGIPFYPNINDANDATLIGAGWFHDGSPPNTYDVGAGNIRFNFDSFTFPADTVIDSVQGFVRHYVNGTDGGFGAPVFGDTTAIVGDTTGTFAPEVITTSDTTTLGTDALTSRTNRASGGAFTQSDIDGLNMSYRMIQESAGSNASGSWVIADMWFVVTYTVHTDPTATVTAPTGTITDTNQPDVTWTYADTESDPQNQYHAKIFTKADTLEGTFDPETWPAVWDSGVVGSSGTTATVDEALSADIEFKAYVKVSDAVTGFGAWDDGPDFTILATGFDQPGRVFFALTSGPGSDGAGFWEFDDANREGSFSFKSAPLRDPGGRQVEIREVQVYAKSYDANASVTITVNGVSKVETITVPGRQQLSFRFRERGETLDVKVESTAGDPTTAEAPTIEAVRIGWRPGHALI